ncbi:MAG: DUF4038 domain-containing protein [Parcubacteria group bacterium]
MNFQFNNLQKLLFSAILFFGIFGLVQSSQAAGVLRVHPTNLRYFTDDSGKAIYLTGSHTWNNFIDSYRTTLDFNDYLNFFTVTNHFNFMRLWVQSEVPHGSDHPLTIAYNRVSGHGNASDGELKFNLSSLNQIYFDRLRARVVAAQSRGLYVGVMLFEGWGLQFDRNANDGYPYDSGNNINGIACGAATAHSLVCGGAITYQKAYVKKVIDTLNDLDNVTWEVANEAGAYSTSWQAEIINYVKTYEATLPKQHLIGMTFQYAGGSNSTLFSSNADWVSPNIVAASPYNYENNPPPGDGSKIVIVDTDHLGQWTRGDADWVWKTFTRGHHTIYMDLPVGSEGGYLAQIQGARAAMGQTLTYADKMNLASMIPSANSSDCSTTYCLRNHGQEYLIYQPGSGAFTVNLSAATYNYEWFNPTTGAVVETGTFTAGAGNKSFTPPFSGDAVLYLKKVSDTISPAAPQGLSVQ